MGMSVEDRWRKKFDVLPHDGCHLWKRPRKSGYGVFTVNKEEWRAHRFAFLLKHGDVPADGLQVDHLCRVKHCVNALHLEAVTGSENTKRGMTPPVVTLLEGECARGHDLSSTGVYVWPKIDRCVECQRIDNEAAGIPDYHAWARENYAQDRENAKERSKRYRDSHRDRVSEVDKVRNRKRYEEKREEILAAKRERRKNMTEEQRETERAAQRRRLAAKREGEKVVK